MKTETKKRLLILLVLAGVLAPVVWHQTYDVRIVPCKVESITIHGRASILSGSPKYSIQAVDVEGNVYNAPITHDIFVDLKVKDWVPMRVYRNRITNKISAEIHE